MMPLVLLLLMQILLQLLLQLLLRVAAAGINDTPSLVAAPVAGEVEGGLRLARSSLSLFLGALHCNTYFQLMLLS
jgi:hypothetical protein